ncbi:MAG TPA: XRE family transcriptional regulator [Pseudonocardiaceae bacterium]|nr:XRE family transcriptional regulator [Pseudonocardiaceae bacterium]
MSLINQHSGPALTTSQRDWLRVREYLQQHRYNLGQAAAEEYPDVLKVEGTPLLTRPEWLPIEPIPLDSINLEFAPDLPFNGLTGANRVTASVRPERPDGSRYPTYSAAMADLAAPAVFENRSTYRLLDGDLAGPCGQLVFGRGTYFDSIDLGEAAAHEFAAFRCTGSDTPLRVAIGNPCDSANRPTNLAISALTIRHDRVTGEATSLLHWRDPAKVGHAGGLYMIVPVGIFQASDDQPCNERNDFSLWRCLVREYAEELLGESEVHSGGQTPINYETWHLAARMTNALRSGLISAHVLGMGVDPLTYATDLLSVVVFDARLFDELFASMVDTNAEGRLVSLTPKGAGHEGFPFTTDYVRQMVRHPSMQAAGAAALTLAQRSALTSQPPPH